MTMENAVEHDQSLHEMACQAYVSYVRSYASYPKEIREIFSFKALHLGHLVIIVGLSKLKCRIR